MIGQGVFVRRVPENGMFPQESEIVLNTVLSANALAHDYFDVQLLGCNTKQTDKLKINVFLHT
jgi:hypothetical protein